MKNKEKTVYGLRELLARSPIRKRISVTDMSEALCKIINENFDGVARIFDKLSGAGYYAVMLSEENAAELLASIIAFAAADSPLKIELSYTAKNFVMSFIGDEYFDRLTDKDIAEITRLAENAGFKAEFKGQISLSAPLVAREVVVRAISRERFYSVLKRAVMARLGQ